MADPHRLMLTIEVLMPCFYSLILLLSFVVGNKYKPLHSLCLVFGLFFKFGQAPDAWIVLTLTMKISDLG